MIFRQQIKALEFDNVAASNLLSLVDRAVHPHLGNTLDFLIQPNDRTGATDIYDYLNGLYLLTRCHCPRRQPLLYLGVRPKLE